MKPSDLISKRLREIAVFMARLLVFSSPLLIFMCWSSLLYPLQSAVSNIVFSLTKISGIPVSLPTPTTLSLLCKSGEQVLLNVEWQCTGVLSMSLFFALVMAIPNTAFKEKAKVLLVGEPVLFSLNLLRIYVTALCGYHYGMQTMILVHQVVWEALMPLLTVGAWLTWLYFTKLHGHKKRET